MPIAVARLLRRVVVAVVCVTSVLLLVAAPSGLALAGTGAVASPASLNVRGGDATPLATSSRARHPSSPLVLGGNASSVLAYPPASSFTPLAVVYLHGMHGRADRGCPWFRSGASEVGWLVCPDGIEVEPDGRASWGADVVRQAAAVAGALRLAHAEGASREPGVAIGFSQGSYVALDLVRARAARFRGLVLLAADVHPDVQRLRAGGVERVVLGAGSRDRAYAAMRDEAHRLASEGMDARFLDLGAVGHTYTTEDPEALREAIAWAGGRR